MDTTTASTTSAATSARSGDDPRIRRFRRSRRVYAAAGALLLVAGLGACSSSSDGGPAAASPGSGGKTATSAPASSDARQACDVLTPELAAKVVGTTKAPKHDTNTQGDVTVSQCTYVGANGVISSLVRHDPTQSDTVDSTLESIKTVTYEGETTTDVPGLGDAALFAPKEGQLTFFDGDDMVILTGGTLDQLKPLAQAALGS